MTLVLKTSIRYNVFRKILNQRCQENADIITHTIMNIDHNYKTRFNFPGVLGIPSIISPGIISMFLCIINTVNPLNRFLKCLKLLIVLIKIIKGIIMIMDEFTSAVVILTGMF